MSAARTAAEPFDDFVGQSLEEAAFLWKRWESDLDHPTRNLDEAWIWTEDRLHGALDGVRVAGERIVQVTEEALQGEHAAMLAAAAHVLAAQSPVRAREALATAVRQAGGVRLEAIARGIETAALDGTFAPVAAALAGGGPEHAAALCRVKSFRRSTPGRELLVALESQMPRLEAQALRSLATSADESHLPHLERGLSSGHMEVRRAAIATGIRRRMPAAWDAAVQLAGRRDRESAPFLPALAALGTPAEQQLVISALREPALRRAGLFALAYVGTPEAVEICLTGMRNAVLARCAGEAYCAITGAELVRDGLAAPEPPEESAPPFEADALDADLVPAASDLWPLPDIDAVRRHWQGIQGRFHAAARHWRGRPFDPGVLIDALESGPMLRRGDLAQELAIRSNGRHDVETRAFAQVQRGAMSAARGAA
ncbi:MAG: hypothetical protein ACREUG_02915, partial [Steroidobacteraceae bacterium]